MGACWGNYEMPKGLAGCLARVGEWAKAGQLGGVMGSMTVNFGLVNFKAVQNRCLESTTSCQRQRVRDSLVLDCEFRCL